MSNGRGGSMNLNSRGFSLVELLVVVAIFGVVSTVILDLYVNVLRSTVSSEEVVEVQQGMRLALEQVARDIQVAGFLVPTEEPITTASNNQLTLVTASAFNSFARIDDTGQFPAGSGEVDHVTINVANAAMARLFSDGNYVRIVDPMSGDSLGIFQVENVNVSSLHLKPLATLAADVDFSPGDMIVQVPSPADDPTYPNIVTYSLTAGVLNRDWKVGASAAETTLATNISNLSFEYLMDDDTVATNVVSPRLDNIVGVRIHLTGLTEAAKTGKVSKIRELQTTVKLRNR